MKYFALREIRLRHSTDGGPEWDVQNCRLGGYTYLKSAIKAILTRAKNGTILDENRVTVALIQEGKVKWLMK